MKFDMSFERVYPQSLRSVWDAVTTREALGEWLMETDFAPQQGQEFQMWCQNPGGGTDHYLCKVIAINPPRQMLWSWTIKDREEEGEMFIEFRLEEIHAGTRVTIRHYGDGEPLQIDAFKGGWPGKLDLLEQNLVNESK